MGVETDLLLATSDQADAVLASFDPAKDFSGVYAKGIDPISLGALLGVFTAEGYRDEMIDEFPTIATGNDGDKGVYRVSDRLRKHLEDLSADAIPDIVERWMATEEFELTGWDDVISREFLMSMKKMLSRSDAKDRELWMAISV